MAAVEFKYGIHQIVLGRISSQEGPIMILGRYTMESKDASDLYCHENIYRCRNSGGNIMDISEFELKPDKSEGVPF